MAVRFKEELSPAEYALILSDKNAESLSVLAELIATSELIDPDTAFGFVQHLFFLDTFSVYGEDIWNLYKHVCGNNTVNLMAILRGVQLGILDRDQLHKAIEEKGADFNIEEVETEVKKRLPGFNRGVPVGQDTPSI